MKNGAANTKKSKLQLNEVRLSWTITDSLRLSGDVFVKIHIPWGFFFALNLSKYRFFLVRQSPFCPIWFPDMRKPKCFPGSVPGAFTIPPRVWLACPVLVHCDVPPLWLYNGWATCLFECSWKLHLWPGSVLHDTTVKKSWQTSIIPKKFFLRTLTLLQVFQFLQSLQHLIIMRTKQCYLGTSFPLVPQWQ